MFLPPTLMVSLALQGIGLPQSDTLRYRMFELFQGGEGREYGNKVNSKGWVLAGRWNGPNWLWRPGIGWSQLPTYQGYEHTEARDLNDAGFVACELANGGRNDAGFWTPSQGLRKVDMPANHVFRAIWSINSSGDFVGQCINRTTQRGHGWLYSQTRGTIDLGESPDGTATTARAINDKGDVLGWHLEGGLFHSVHVWFPGNEYKNFGHPKSGGFYGFDMNNQGDIVGQEGTLGVLEDVRWRDGSWTDLGKMPNADNHWGAYAINNSRMVVGYGGVNGVPHAVLWRPSFGSQLVEDLVDDSKQGYTINAVVDVTDNGLMTGWASKPGDVTTRPILLVPYPSKSNK